MVTLTGKITDVSSRAPDSISSITVKAPSARIGGGSDIIVTSPAKVTFDRTTGDVTISGLHAGLSWLYIEGDGWSDSIPLAVAEGFQIILEAIANASGVPGVVDYISMIRSSGTHAQALARAAVEGEFGEVVRLAQSAAATAEQAATSADARATSAETTVDAYTPRVDALEAMAGLSPESPVDGQTANLIDQPETLTRGAVGRAIEEWSDTVGKGVYAANLPTSVRSAEAFGVSPSDPDAGVTINSALDALPAGATLYLDGEYTTLTSIVITKPVQIIGPAKITAKHDNPLFDVQTNDVVFDGGLRLVGRQRDTFSNLARGISFEGTVDNYRENLHVGKVSFDTFAGGGVIAEFARNITTSEGFEVVRSKYWGVAFISCDTVKMYRPVIRDVHQQSPTNDNAYGITATHRDGDPDTNPSSVNVTIEEPLIEDVPTWVGIDTHGGKRLSIIRPTVRRCRWGISLVSGPGADGSEQRGPIDFLVDSPLVEDCSGYGIGVSGAGISLGEWAELATGTILNPVISRCGDPTANTSGAIWLRNTKGLRLSGLRAFEPGSHGVCLYFNNFDFHLEDIVVVDPWSNTHALPSVIAQRSAYNTGNIESFRGLRGDKQATYVLAFGLHSGTAEATSINLGAACVVDSGILLAEPGVGNRLSFENQSTIVKLGRPQSEMGFYGVTPVVRQTVPAAATDATSAQSLVNELRAALVALGIVK